MGRPSDYSEELADDICAVIATSAKGLDKLCEENAWPEARTIYRWIIQHEEFCQKYARAREMQQHLLADQLLPLADTDRICRKVTTKADGSEETVVLDQVERSKLQIETRKWILGRLNPKKWGDKLAHTGEDGGAIQFVVTRAGKKE